MLPESTPPHSKLRGNALGFVELVGLTWVPIAPLILSAGDKKMPEWHPSAITFVCSDKMGGGESIR